MLQIHVLRVVLLRTKTSKVSNVQMLLKVTMIIILLLALSRIWSLYTNLLIHSLHLYLSS